MVGRTPTFLGKQVRQQETKLVAFYMILGTAVVLVLTSIAIATAWGRAGTGRQYGRARLYGNSFRLFQLICQ